MVLKRAAMVMLVMLAAGGCSVQQRTEQTEPHRSAVSTTTIRQPARQRPLTTTAPLVSRQRVLRFGTVGTDVRRVQQRLSDLGYWLGTPDGRFGALTQQAVYAFEKSAGLAADGVVGPRVRAALDHGLRARPRSRAGSLLEIDRERGLVLIVRKGRVFDVLNASVGGGYTYWQYGRPAVALTPVGHFSFWRQVNGADVSPLGVLWRPKYFLGGFALHGYAEVPPIAVSHGCVRVSIPAMNWIWANSLAPLGSLVWVY